MDLGKKSKIPSFSNPIYIFDSPYGDIFRSELIKECMRWRNETESIDKEFYTESTVGWQSKKILFNTKEPSLQKVSQLIIKGILNATQDIAPGFDVSKYNMQAEGWINVNEKETLHKPHIHGGGSIFSGVNYVKIPKSESQNEKK